MKKIILLTVFNLSLIISNAQIIFEKTYGNNSYQKGIAILQAEDDGYLIAGNIDSSGSGSADIFILRTKVNGDTLWVKKFGSANNDFLSSVKMTSTGFIITGYTNSTENGSDIFLLNTDKNGNIQWEKTFAGTGNQKSTEVIQNINKDYIVTGNSDNGLGGLDVCVLAADSTGNILWFKKYGGVNDDSGNSINLTSDGGYIIAGETNSFGTSTDAYLIKIDNNGNRIWSKAIGGNNNDCAKSCIQTSDGGYVFTGASDSWGSNDVYVVKTDNLGAISWTKIIGGTESDFGNCVAENNDGSYMIGGQTNSFGSDGAYLIKLNSFGGTTWTRVFNAGVEAGKSVLRTSDGGFIMTGTTGNAGSGLSAYLIKANEYGKTSCANVSIPVIASDIVPVSILSNPTDSVLVSSLTNYSQSFIQLYLVCSIDTKCYSNENIAASEMLTPLEESAGDLVEVNSEEGYDRNTEQSANLVNSAISEYSFSIYPNPLEGTTINVNLEVTESKEILFVVYDALGREHYSKLILTGEVSETSFAIDPSEKLKPGIYYVTATSEKNAITKKLIVR